MYTYRMTDCLIRVCLFCKRSVLYQTFIVIRSSGDHIFTPRLQVPDVHKEVRAKLRFLIASDANSQESFVLHRVNYVINTIARIIQNYVIDIRRLIVVMREFKVLSNRGTASFETAVTSDIYLKYFFYVFCQCFKIDQSRYRLN